MEERLRRFFGDFVRYPFLMVEGRVRFHSCTICFNTDYNVQVNPNLVFPSVLYAITMPCAYFTMTSNRTHPYVSLWALYFEPISSHAVLVFRHEVGTVFLGIIGVGEEHTFVTL